MRRLNKMTEFSKRTHWDLDESDLARAHRERKTTGLPILDLTASNPTRCGFVYDAELLAPLSRAASFDYEPDPKGLLSARLAVSAYYADHGTELSPENIVLTTSTSEAYTYLFKLLCNPGDTVLVAQPSYPLFDFLAQAESVEVVAAPLVYDFGWQMDLESLRRLLREESEKCRFRAMVLVHPNNPTGHFTGMREREELAAICREQGLALIVDEVFLDYGHTGDEHLGGGPDQSTFVAKDLGVLTFVVSGISKICGLPQMKAAWLAALGPGSAEAMARLEVLADTYLSMNAPVQHALPAWLAARQGVQGQIRGRVAENLAALDMALGYQQMVTRLAVDGGWYAVLRIPAIQQDEVTAQALLDQGVWVHPGYFFGFLQSGWLVVSLLGNAQEFLEGITRVLQYVVRMSFGNL
jgi:alanine-synthesizing transaminase